MLFIFIVLFAAHNIWADGIEKYPKINENFSEFLREKVIKPLENEKKFEEAFKAITALKNLDEKKIATSEEVIYTLQEMRNLVKKSTTIPLGTPVKDKSDAIKTHYKILYTLPFHNIKDTLDIAKAWKSMGLTHETNEEKIKKEVENFALQFYKNKLEMFKDFELFRLDATYRDEGLKFSPLKEATSFQEMFEKVLETNFDNFDKKKVTKNKTDTLTELSGVSKYFTNMQYFLKEKDTEKLIGPNIEYIKSHLLENLSLSIKKNENNIGQDNAQKLLEIVQLLKQPINNPKNIHDTINTIQNNDPHKEERKVLQEKLVSFLSESKKQNYTEKTTWQDMVDKLTTIMTEHKKIIENADFKIKTLQDTKDITHAKTTLDLKVNTMEQTVLDINPLEHAYAQIKMYLWIATQDIQTMKRNFLKYDLSKITAFLSVNQQDTNFFQEVYERLKREENKLSGILMVENSKAKEIRINYKNLTESFNNLLELLIPKEDIKDLPDEASIMNNVEIIKENEEVANFNEKIQQKKIDYAEKLKNPLFLSSEIKDFEDFLNDFYKKTMGHIKNYIKILDAIKNKKSEVVDNNNSLSDDDDVEFIIPTIENYQKSFSDSFEKLTKELNDLKQKKEMEIGKIDSPYRKYTKGFYPFKRVESFLSTYENFIRNIYNFLSSSNTHIKKAMQEEENFKRKKEQDTKVQKLLAIKKIRALIYEKNLSRKKIKEILESTKIKNYDNERNFWIIPFYGILTFEEIGQLIKNKTSSSSQFLDIQVAGIFKKFFEENNTVFEEGELLDLIQGPTKKFFNEIMKKS